MGRNIITTAKTLIEFRNMTPGSNFTVWKSNSKVTVTRAGVNRGHLICGDLSDIYLKHLLDKLTILFENICMHIEVCCQHSSLYVQSLGDSRSNKPLTHTCPIPDYALRLSVWIGLIVVDLNG